MSKENPTTETTGESVNRFTTVQWALRCLGVLDLCALIAFVIPREWIAIGHTTAGLGDLPAGPLVGYLARSASFLYAMHGLFMIYLSFDVPRYWSLIRFLAWIKVLHGAIMLSIDLREGMPLWWTIFEGPGFAATGLIVVVALAIDSPDKRDSVTL